MIHNYTFFYCCECSNCKFLMAILVRFGRAASTVVFRRLLVGLLAQSQQPRRRQCQKLLHPVLNIILPANPEECFENVVDCRGQAADIILVTFQRGPMKGIVIWSQFRYGNLDEGHQQADQNVLVLVNLGLLAAQRGSEREVHLAG